MKTTLKLIAVLILVVTTFGQPTHASTGGGSAFRLKGLSGNAFFSSADPSGCIYTDVSVFATEQIVSAQPGRGSSFSGASLFISQYDACTGTQLLAADGYLPLADPDLQISRQLDSASLNATVPMFDYVSNSTFDVTVSLNWTAISSVGRQVSHNSYQFSGCKISSHLNSTFRFAEVTGGVTDGVTDFTPAPPVDATISNVKSGDHSTGCS